MATDKTEVATNGTFWKKDQYVPVSKIKSCLVPLVNYTNSIHQCRKIQNCAYLKVV